VYDIGDSQQGAAGARRGRGVFFSPLPIRETITHSHSDSTNGVIILLVIGVSSYLLLADRLNMELLDAGRGKGRKIGRGLFVNVARVAKTP